MNNWHLKYRPLACCKSCECMGWSWMDKASRHILIKLTKVWENPSGSEGIQMNFRKKIQFHLLKEPKIADANEWRKPFKFRRKQGWQRKWLLPDHYLTEPCGHLVPDRFPGWKCFCLGLMQAKWHLPIFCGSQWPSTAWLPAGCSSSCWTDKKCLETQSILPDNVKKIIEKSVLKRPILLILVWIFVVLAFYV